MGTHKEGDREATFAVLDARGLTFHTCDFHLKVAVLRVFEFDDSPNVRVRPL